MSTILVTGGAGFLGSHLTGSLDSISNLKNHERFTFIRHNVIKAFPEEVKKVDRIYHLACPASPKRFPENPRGILETCFLGTQNVLELAVQCNARVLLASTSEVYGDPLVCPQPESYHGNVNPFGPRSCYDEGKRVAEALAYAYLLQQKLDVRIVRIFNVYGPNMRPDDGRVVPNFISAALAGNDIEITGDGKASRCFQYASDCISGMCKLMESDVETAVNIGCEDETSIGKLATLISEIVVRKTGKPPVSIKLTPKREDDPFRRRPDITLAREKLGWEPKVPLMEGLEATVDWFLTL